MKFTLDYDFTLEVGENTYKGTLSEPTKKQSKDMKALTDNFLKIGKEVKALENELEVLRAKLEKDSTNEKTILAIQKAALSVDEKTEQLEGYNLMEEVSKMRLELCMKGDKEITELAEQYGYHAVLNTIQEDIQAKKKDALKP